MVIFAVPTIIYWTAFYPGNMFVDTYFQFTQIFGTLPPGDWHPYGHTFFMRVIMMLTNEPAMIVFVQIAALLYIMYCFFSELCMLGYNRKFVYLMSFLLSVNVSYGLQVTNVWKDTLYTISQLYLMFFLYKNYESGFRDLHAKAAGGAGFLGVLLFRHNGALVCIVLLILMLVLSGFKRNVIVFAGIIYGSYFLFTGFGYTAIGVEPKAKVISYLPMLHGIAAVEEQLGSQELDKETKQLMDKLLPEEVWIEKYSPYSGDPYLFDTDNILQQNCEKYSLMDIFIPYLKTLIKHPFIIVKDRFASCELNWSFFQAEGSYNHIIGGFIDNSSFENDARLNSDFNIQSAPPNKVTHLIQKCFRFIYNNTALNALHFRPAWLMWLLGIVLILSWIYDRKSIIIALPVCINSISLMIAMNFQAFRYVWVVFESVPVIVLLLLGKCLIDKAGTRLK